MRTKQLLLTTTLLLGLASACQKEQTSTPEPEGPLVGIWEYASYRQTEYHGDTIISDTMYAEPHGIFQLLRKMTFTNTDVRLENVDGEVNNAKYIYKDGALIMYQNSPADSTAFVLEKEQFKQTSIEMLFDITFINDKDSTRRQRQRTTYIKK